MKGQDHDRVGHSNLLVRWMSSSSHLLPRQNHLTLLIQRLFCDAVILSLHFTRVGTASFQLKGPHPFVGMTVIGMRIM
jgi:hypothetical protein